MSTATPALDVQGLRKAYDGRPVLDGVDLRVEEGEVFGFLGPNGAGKTTTIRILLGLARPTSGQARVLGHDVTAAGNQVRRQIGYLPDVPGYYPWMTALGFLRFTGRLFGLDRATIDERSQALLSMAGLEGVTHRVGTFSRGMKQRLGIAQALMNAPRLLVLDEPTSALDPLGRHEVLDMIAALRGRTTVLFSTHILADAEGVCDRVAVLDAGRVVTGGRLDELRQGLGNGTRLHVHSTDDATLAEALGDQPWLVGVEGDEQGLTLSVTDPAAAQLALPSLCASHRLGLVQLTEVRATLEEVFLQTIERGHR